MARNAFHGAHPERINDLSRERQTIVGLRTCLVEIVARIGVFDMYRGRGLIGPMDCLISSC